ncbi:MAG: hypothetical protein NT133_12050 [Alphaproteobacteria bacterium]|nr:hypothetical protein [Alphaproteobacteria bacterium]
MRNPLIPVLVVALLPVAAWGSVFDQGVVETREFRNPVLARAALAEGVETESLFGFVLGSDVDAAGSRGVALETVLGVGRRGGAYRAAGSKLEFSYGMTDSVSVSLGLLGGWRGIRNVPGLSDANAVRFDGVGTELRWRLLDREAAPVGLTLHIEPSVRFHDEVSGERGQGVSAENKLIIDQALVPGRLYAAVNLMYDVERFRPAGGPVEAASTMGIGVAMTYQVSKGLFLGAETRYLRAYEGLAFGRYRGEAMFAGPSLFWSPAHGLFVSAAVDVQVAGRETGSAAALDLADFSRVQARIKIGMEF